MSNELDPMHTYAAVFPKFNDLTSHQRKALNATSPFYITGPAGCGKSVVVLWKLINNLENNKNSILFTYNRMLNEYLKICAQQATGNNNDNHIKSIYKALRSKDNYEWYWDKAKADKYNNVIYEVIIDEAQDLEAEAFEILAPNVPYLSISADFNQQLYKNRVKSKEEIDAILSKYNRRTQEFHLNQIYRYPIAIYRFVINFIQKGESAESLNWLEQKAKRENINQILPKVYDGIPKDKEMERLISIIKSYKETNIAILLPHAPDTSYKVDNDKYKSSVKYYYDQLSQSFTCSYYTSDTGQDKQSVLGKIHISTFKSAKGLEFDTVIIPQIELIDDAFTNQLNEYYVALTRAKTNLILLSNKRVENIYKFNKIDSSLYDKISYTEQKSLYEIDF
ncbi:DNA/RNA helicase domain-containing protein [Campylobacter devanensis]|uniref:DNA/RNA helicase domain-containing protein n=1 Tax=Campylobacter devanensis TaxID=3161138 RepID=UPI000A343B04|nr:DNA/RNA helicase domain-containing protein [Campylobacter sp. P160]